MTQLIGKILKSEWEDFQRLHNVGGRAPCQDDARTFVIMRGAQFMSWSTQMLGSYYQDLHSARQQGRNLLQEKYARMMEYTHPEEYWALEQYLPPLEPEVRDLVDEIMEVQQLWQNQYAAQYPKLAARARPLSASGDSGDNTSFATYLKGELLTFSPQTLRLYRDHIKTLQAQNINMTVQCMHNTAQMYGFDSVAGLEQSQP